MLRLVFPPISIHTSAERAKEGLCLSSLIIVGVLQSLAGSANPGQTAGLRESPSTETRSVRVMDFRSLTAPLTVALRYTALLPGAAGQAEIEPGRVGLKIHLIADELPPASQLRPECLTYVLWAVTPEGRASNLGEIQLSGAEGRLNTKMVPSRFGLIVTAEPYFAVSQPSKTVVFEADLAPGSTAVVSVTHASCELLTAPVGADIVAPSHPAAGDPGAPLILEEARRAIAVAQRAGAQQFAPETLATAEQLLQLAEDQEAHGAAKKDVIDTGSEAVLIGEDARVLAVKRQQRARQNASPNPPP
jgi:hypothetical protein